MKTAQINPDEIAVRPGWMVYSKGTINDGYNDGWMNLQAKWDDRFPGRPGIIHHAPMGHHQDAQWAVSG